MNENSHRHEVSGVNPNIFDCGEMFSNQWKGKSRQIVHRVCTGNAETSSQFSAVSCQFPTSIVDPAFEYASDFVSGGHCVERALLPAGFSVLRASGKSARSI
jgi:hypothetical protein